jgi:hypothetical protein
MPYPKRTRAPMPLPGTLYPDAMPPPSPYCSVAVNNADSRKAVGESAHQDCQGPDQMQVPGPALTHRASVSSGYLSSLARREALRAGATGRSIPVCNTRQAIREVTLTHPAQVIDSKSKKDKQEAAQTSWILIRRTQRFASSLLQASWLLSVNPASNRRRRDKAETGQIS